MFEKHFQEWRHAHGMRMLRIPNTIHFHNITKIDEARSLYDKIKRELVKGKDRKRTTQVALLNESGKEGGLLDPNDPNVARSISEREGDEEVEDSMGNVYNRKTFDDLKRQGLLL
jgi:splicing factor 3A subunit 3